MLKTLIPLPYYAGYVNNTIRKKEASNHMVTCMLQSHYTRNFTIVYYQKFASFLLGVWGFAREFLEFFIKNSRLCGFALNFCVATQILAQQKNKLSTNFFAIPVPHNIVKTILVETVTLQISLHSTPGASNLFQPRAKFAVPKVWRAKIYR